MPQAVTPAATAAAREGAPRRAVVGDRPALAERNVVLLAGGALIALQLGFRAWASFRGWFYADDFEFLFEAVGQPLTLAHLLEPHDSQLMPGGLLAAWLVERSGTWNWTLAAAILLGLQALASAACLWMLVRLFGRRWGVLPLLALYLFSTLTLTSYLWWAAAINQVPMHAAAFAAVALHVDHLRSGRRRSAVLAGLAIALGLCFYVKTILVLIPLAVLTLTHFTDTSGSPRAVLRRLWRRHRALVLGYGGLAVAYVALYVTTVPSPVDAGEPIDYGGLADAMFRRSLGPALLGGPWEWSNDNPPVARVATPEWAVTLSWLVLLGGLAVALRRRRGAWRGLLVAAPYLLASYLLTAWGRAADLGAFAGLELRYLSDSTPVLVLALGLLVLPLRSAAEPLAPAAEHQDAAEDARGPSRSRRWTAAASTAVVVIGAGAAWSNLSYAGYWETFPAESYVKTVTSEAQQQPLLVLDEPVPELVMSVTSFPSNLPSRLLAPLGDRVQAVDQGTDPQILGSSGQPFAPAITGGASALPGPDGDCGYRVDADGTEIEMTGSPEDFFWWASVSYLAAGDTTVTLTIGGTSRQMPVREGLHRWFVRGEGSVDGVSVRAEPDAPGLCIDQVAIGDVAPLEPM